MTLSRVLVLLTAIALTAAWFARAPLLRDVAELWVIPETELEPADAVVVLGGGLDVRPFVAADYYHRGLVGKILVANAKPGQLDKIGLLPSDAELNRQVLLKRGVPDSAIETFGSNVASTRDEAVALRDWARAHHARRLIVPTHLFSSRRTRWILDRLFSATATEVRVMACKPPEYGITDWWHHEEGLMDFQNEVVKYLYYRIKYAEIH